MTNNITNIEEMFNETSTYQAYLDVEVALANAQAKQGIIPQKAAETIKEFAKIELLDLDTIHEGLKVSGHPLVPLIWELDRVCGPEAGGYIHWGATTQNILQTGQLLVVKRWHTMLLAQLGDLLIVLADLAEKSKDYAMPGRTHGQHAVPLTFGHKVATWIDEMLRHVERLQHSETRVFAAMFGGGGGTLASVGIDGLETQRLVGEELGMSSMPFPTRTTSDHLTEYVMTLSLLSATCSRMAQEVIQLMKQEYGEVEEPWSEGTVGSSTMPQKRNPKLSKGILVWGAELRLFVSLALQSMLQEHEAEAYGYEMIETSIDKTCILTSKIMGNMLELFGGITLFPERMRQNLDLSGGLIMSERIMLELGNTIGRQKAHDAVYDAAQRSVNENRPFSETLAEEEEVTSRLSAAEIMNLMDPETYTGLSAYFAETFASSARETATRIRQHNV